MFEKQISLFERYLNSAAHRWSDDQRALLLEAETRLQQCDYAYERARAAGELSAALWREASEHGGRNPLAVPDQNSQSPRPRQFWQNQFALRYYTESFYYFAWRLQQILTGRFAKELSLKFAPVTGIRAVRNELIEHPEKSRNATLDGGIEITSGPFDVRLKVPKRGHGVDPGLLANATALRDNIDDCLMKAFSCAR